MFPSSRKIINYSCLLTLALLYVGFCCLTGELATLYITVGLVAFGISVTYGVSVSGGGLTMQPQSIVRTASGAIAIEETLIAGTAGVLTTRATDVAGTVTVATGHGIVTGDIIDVHWDIAGVKGVAYKCTVGTVSAPTGDTSIPFTLASGDVLPAQDSAVVICEVISMSAGIDADNTKFLAIEVSTIDKTLRTAAHIQFQDVGAAEIAEIDLVTNVPSVWDLEGGSANPFTGNPITTAKVTNGGASSTETYTLKIIGVQDLTP